MKQRIHILGASGSGTTTIAKAVCGNLDYAHFDSDNYYWLNTVEPFTIERPRDECLRMMEDDLSSRDKWILSGSIATWGNILIPYFDLVVFVYVPRDIRLERLRKREYERYGDEINPGGERYEASKAFLQWAGSYDEGTLSGRSLQKHENWLKDIRCPVLRITNSTLDDSVNIVIDTARM